MNFTIMIVSPKTKDTGYPKQDVQELYRFLSFTGGNFRNSLYVECTHGTGFMMTADENAGPVLFPIRKFYGMTGVLPQKDEMLGNMNAKAFEGVFRQWLVWNTEHSSECAVCKMYEQQIRRC